MDSVHEIAAYFTAQNGNISNSIVPAEFVVKINHLNRAERADLKALLFNEAKKRAVTLSGQEAIVWLENSFVSIEKYAFRFHQVYFSPSYDIPDVMMGLIKNAETTIDVCIFTITHQELAKELIKAHERGIKLRILTDDEKQFDKGSCVRNFQNSGIPVKTDDSRYHMHHKFGIIDNRMVFTGSFNWTYTATKHNQENLLVTSYFDVVDQYLIEFERLWAEMKAIN